MSVEAVPPGVPEANGVDQEPPKKERRRAGKSKPGVSMLAQGEPMVWLSGGALVVCLVMITGLLALCVWSGMGTFWPTPIYRVQLVDDSVHMGEVARYEQYQLRGDKAGTMKGEVGEAARRTVGDAGSVEARRWLLRTGNYELTNEHFNWVSDFAMAQEGVTTPEWALLLERVEKGRFYGQPKEFALRTTRTAAEEEYKLKVILDFLQSNVWRISETTEDNRPKYTEEQQATFNETLTTIQEAFEKERAENVRKFLAEFDAGEDDSRLDVILDGSEVVADVNLREYQVDPARNVAEIKQVWSGPAVSWKKYGEVHEEVRNRFHRAKRMQKHDIGPVSRRQERSRLDVRQAELDHEIFVLTTVQDINTARLKIEALETSRAEAKFAVEQIEKRFGADSPIAAVARRFALAVGQQVDELSAPPKERLAKLEAEIAEIPAGAQRAVEKYLQVSEETDKENSQLQDEIDTLSAENARYQLVMTTAQGQEQSISVGDIVRAYPANQLTLGQKLGIYFSRWWEFLSAEPREANSEGGVFPAIIGTVVMTLIMSLAVVPFGVLAALYLREYAKAGLVVSVVRIAINNLAGVPSIVFGVFGLGFFCYIIGGFIDGGPKQANITPLPPPTWWIFVALTAAAGVGAFFLGLLGFTVRKRDKSQLQRAMGWVSILLWLASVVLLVVVVFKTPFFSGFFEAYLPNPTFGKGGLIWASLTLALLTLPVVIVATEEALSAVPNSLREGSYACGGSKWQTIKRIVLPHAMPGIMTGMILAMARGAGEVAPLMLVGAVNLTHELPIDMSFPFFHGDRSFLHLGFHIYDLGFQSQNSEAAKPMVFTTTLLLIFIIASLNIGAVILRNRLRKRFLGGEF